MNIERCTEELDGERCIKVSTHNDDPRDPADKRTHKKHTVSLYDAATKQRDRFTYWHTTARFELPTFCWGCMKNETDEVGLRCGECNHLQSAVFSGHVCEVCSHDI